MTSFHTSTSRYFTPTEGSNILKHDDDQKSQRSYFDDLNMDLLMDNNLLSSSQVSIPIIDDIDDDDFNWDSTNHYMNIEVQSSMIHPYLLLDFISSFSLSFMLSSSSFMHALIHSLHINTHTDAIVRYIIVKTSTSFYIGLVSYVFINPDTFKSINTTIEYLSINLIIYEYNFINVIKYLGVHISATILGTASAILIYYDHINDISTEILLKSILSTSDTFSFNYSSLFVLLFAHIICATSLTIISNNATSSNAHKKALLKALVVFAISIVSGALVGPIGYTLPNMILHILIVIFKGSYEMINTDIMIIDCVTVICVLILYPIIAINIKFYWRNKYRRYIEYGSYR